MNLETAERLMKLRKQKGYSQEELADKLGISRQAVSKWERAEASPDTDNLIELAKLYGVSLDELLGINTNKEEKTEEKAKEEKTKEEKTKDYVHIGIKGIHIKDGEDEVHIGPGGIHAKDGEDEVHIGLSGTHVKEDKNSNNYTVNIDNTTYYRHRVLRIIKAITFSFLFTAALILYLVLGFKNNDFFRTGWLMFFIPVIISSIFECIINGSLEEFAYPLLAATIYLYIGLVHGMWHPTWVIFISIPVFYLIPPIFKIGKIKRSKDIINNNVVNVEFTENKEEDDDHEN